MTKIKIMLDPGHYGSKYNQSPVLLSYYESNFTWDYHLLLKKYLEQAGFEVVTTRSKKDDNPGVTERGQSSKGCDLFISIHSNASSNTSTDRVVVYHQIGNEQYALYGEQFANEIAPILNEAMGCKGTYQVKTRKSEKGDWDYYGVLRGAASVKTPAVLIEHSYHTNLRATKWLSDSSNLDKMALITCNAVCDFFCVPGISTSTYTAPTQSVTASAWLLKKGHKGDAVKALQTLLGVKADGMFGDNTEKAVKGLQEAHGLTVDGIVGQKTWNELLK